MTLRDLLKRKEKVEETPAFDSLQNPEVERLSYEHDPPEFTFLRTTTNTQEIISPPSHPEDTKEAQDGVTQIQPAVQPDASTSSRSPSRLRRSFIRHREPKDTSEGSTDTKISRSLSERLHLKSRRESTSNNDNAAYIVEGDIARDQEGEAQWEKRATILAENNPLIDQSIVNHRHSTLYASQGEKSDRRSRSPSISNPEGDETLQEAIRLHEEGNLQRSTALFGRLADPQGANNALSQVLYGLALRHGWGISKDEPSAVKYLSYAASNSAEIEKLALEAGSKKGGAAKGELTLAIFELANCFRNGWGVARDPVAAKQYYETAANMGDLDAMNEIAWCYVEGFGCKKDKFKAAQYLRLAEERGNKTVGNSW